MSNIKNVEAFGKLNGICIGFGEDYVPVQQNLQVNAMSTLLNNARQVMDEYKSARTDFSNATHQREEVFKDMQRLSARIVHALVASGASPSVVAAAKVSVRMLGGKKIPDRVPMATDAVPAQPTPKVRKARGFDYVSMADHFAQLVVTVSKESNYHPNETELSVAALVNKATELQNLNSAVVTATIQLSNVRIKRNALLYNDAGSLVATAAAAKSYVKSMFGPRSEQSRELERIQFTKPNT